MCPSQNMSTQKCTSCSRAPQAESEFLDKFGRSCNLCLKCRLKTAKNRKSGRDRKCEHCAKQPTFSFPGVKPGIRCSDHKDSGMVNVMSLKCSRENCDIQPCYNFPSELFGIVCATHKKDGMINLRERSCETKCCLKKPFYNFSTETKGRFCREHALDGMIDVLSHSCANEECNKRATFNHPGQKAKFCATHKSEEMIDVKSKRCKTSMCDVITGTKEYCSRCTSYMFPHNPSRFKTRENAVGKFLRETYPDKDILHDKRVECHLYRPDFVFDLGSHTIVVEIDENQHKTYDTSCDNKRLMSIFQGLGSRPMVMIRFNPDAHKGAKGCWTKDGTLVSGGRPWAKRLGVLKTRIDHWLYQNPEREITFEHLFFDGY